MPTYPYSKERQEQILTEVIRRRRVASEALGFPVLTVRKNLVTYAVPVVLFLTAIRNGKAVIYFTRRGSGGDYEGYDGTSAGYPKDGFDMETGLYTVESPTQIACRELGEEFGLIVRPSLLEALPSQTTVDFLYNDLVPCAQDFFMYMPTPAEILAITPDSVEMTSDGGWWTHEEVDQMIAEALRIEETSGASDKRVLVMPASYGPPALLALEITQQRYDGTYQPQMPAVIG